MHLTPPFRAEHVGSLLRPTSLFQKREALEKGECTLEDVRALEDEAIKHVVALQQQVGIKGITDGEIRRFATICIPCGAVFMLLPKGSVL